MHDEGGEHPRHGQCRPIGMVVPDKGEEGEQVCGYICTAQKCVKKHKFEHCQHPGDGRGCYLKYFTVFEPFSTFCHFCEAWQENFSRADQISVTALQKGQTSSLYDSGQFCTLQRKNSKPSSQLFHRSTDKQLPPRPGRMSSELIRTILPWRALPYRCPGPDG